MSLLEGRGENFSAQSHFALLREQVDRDAHGALEIPFLNVSKKEDYYANVIPRTVPLVFNIRMDPFESYASKDSYGHLLQKVSWLIQPMGVLMKQHLETLAKYPPVQGGSSFDMSNAVEQFMKHPRQ